MSASASAPAGKSITIKSRDEILFMKEANQIVAEILVMLQRTVAPGITTYELDRLAEDLCTKRKAKPAFKGYRGFPGSLCVSINEEVVHGIPSRRRKLKKGDIISVDFGTLYNGYYGDSAVTIPVVASGGAGCPEHMADAILLGGAEAALAASIFHNGEYTIRQTKQIMHGRGIPVRL